MRPEVCVGAVVRRGGEVLLIKRANPPQAGRWSIPGGRVEAGESLHDALRREVLEETGIRVDVVRFIEVVERVSVGHHFVILDYLAAPTDPTDAAGPQAATDAAEARWIPVHDLVSYDLSDGLLDFLRNHALV